MVPMHWVAGDLVIPRGSTVNLSRMGGALKVAGALPLQLPSTRGRHCIVVYVMGVAMCVVGIKLLGTCHNEL